MILPRIILLLLSIQILLATLAESALGQVYSSNPATGTFKNVGNGFRFRVSAINGSNVTFEVMPKTVGGTFGSSGTAVIKKTSTTGTTVGTGIQYSAGASSAGTVVVDMKGAAANHVSGNLDFYVIRLSSMGVVDTNVWDGPITITASNQAPTTSVTATLLGDGRLEVRVTANDESTNSLGSDLYLSVTGNLNSFNFSSKKTTANLTRNVQSTFYYSAAELASYCTAGNVYRVRSNVYDGSGLEGVGYSAQFTMTASNQAPTTSVTATLLGDGRLEVRVTANDESTNSLGSDLYLSVTGNLNSFNFSSKKTTANLTRNVQSTFYYSAAELASYCTAGNVYRVRSNVYDGSGLEGVGYSAQFTMTAGNQAPVITTVSGATQLPDGRIQVQFSASDSDGDGMHAYLVLQRPDGTFVAGASAEVYFTTVAAGANSLYFSLGDLAGMTSFPAGQYRVRIRVGDATHISIGSQSPQFTGYFDYAPVQSTNTFSFPLGDRRVPTALRDGDGWYDAQDFGGPYPGKGYHLGEDWNAESGGNTDCNEPVFSAGDGTVVYSQNAGSGWGNVIIIRHNLPDGSQVEFLYGHLMRRDVSLNVSVAKGQQIGTVGDGDGDYACHLHFELRTSTCPNWGGAGPGYSTTQRPSGWLDPTDFIASHATVATGVNFTLFRVSDTSGALHTANPGATKVLFTPGQTVRVTLKAFNTGNPTATYAMCNVRTSAGTTTYRSPKNAGTATGDGALGGGVGVTGGATLGAGQTAYFSFDVPTSDYANGTYDVSGRLWQTVSGPGLDSTAAGIGDLLDDTWWTSAQFTITSNPTAGGNGSILGVDVSQHNGDISWSELAEQGVRFAWARSTLGVGISDTRYLQNATGAAGAGVLFGAYHFAYPVYTGGSNTAEAEAQWFVSRAGSQIGPGFLPPALDIENDGEQNPVISSLSTQALTDWTLAWCREVLRLTGIRPIVYLNSSFAATEVDARIAAEFPLWLANYGTNSGSLDLNLNPSTGVWSSWQVWQFTSRGVMAGNGSTYIDRNVFSGDEASFQTFIQGGDTPVAEPTDPMWALHRTTPQVMANLANPNAATSHFEARIMVRRIMENFLGRTLTGAELLAISSASPFDDPTVKSGPVVRQEVFKMLVGAVETIKGYTRPVTAAPTLSDLPASGWEREAILGAFAWQVADAADISSGQIRPAFSVPRYRFAKWAVQMMDVLLNPPVPGPTAAMTALSLTTPAVMSDLSAPRSYTSHFEARIMVKRTIEIALARPLTASELSSISSATPFDDSTLGTGPVARREVLAMVLAGLEVIGEKTRPALLGLTLDDLPATGWQREAILGCNAWGIFDAEDAPSSEIYESARVSRYTFAKWDQRLLSLLSMVEESAFSQWISAAGFTGEQAEPSADPDGDGATNFMEYATGTAPGAAQSVERSSVGLTDTGAMEFSFKRISALSNLTYDVEISSNMVQWSPVARSSEGGITQSLGTPVQHIADPGGAAPTVIVRLAAPSVGNRFVRLRVVSQ